MARGKVNVGGAGVSEQTVAPTLNLIEAGLDFITVLVTNKDTEVAKLAITQSNITVDNANDIELAFNETAEVTISLLTEATEYNITVQATATDKVISEITTLTESTLEIPLWYGSRGVFAGGYDGSGDSDVIDYITIATPGNATDFGNLISARNYVAACSDGSRGLFGGGGNSSTPFNLIEYITISTPGNATDFGDLTVARGQSGACSDGSRGIWGGSDPASNVIDYVTIATLGNAIDFGNLSVGRAQSGACSNETYGVFAGGTNGYPNVQNVIDYVIIATPGNATDFGNLLISRYSVSACSSAAGRGIFAGGDSTWNPNNQNIIEYITINTPSNAIDFGNLTISRRQMGACSDGSRGIFGGGNDTTNRIEYITIATLGNAIDFGDLTSSRRPTATAGN